MVAAGLATHYVPSAHLKDLEAQLLSLGEEAAHAEAIEGVLAGLQVH